MTFRSLNSVLTLLACVNNKDVRESYRRAPRQNRQNEDIFDIFTCDNKSNPKGEGVAAPMKISQQIQIIKAILAPLGRVENGAEMVMLW